jgi:hypothetical protein
LEHISDEALNKLYELSDKGLSDQEIAQRLNISISFVELLKDERFKKREMPNKMNPDELNIFMGNNNRISIRGSSINSDLLGVNNIGKPNIEVGNGNELIIEADPTLYIRKLALIPEEEALKEIEKIKKDRNLKNKFADAVKAMGIETLKQLFPVYSIVLAGIEELI